MNSLQGQLGELKMKVQIIRKETGKVEEIELTSKVSDQETHEKLMKEIGNGSNSQYSK